MKRSHKNLPITGEFDLDAADFGEVSKGKVYLLHNDLTSKKQIQTIMKIRQYIDGLNKEEFSKPFLDTFLRDIFSLL